MGCRGKEGQEVLVWQAGDVDAVHVGELVLGEENAEDWRVLQHSADHSRVGVAATNREAKPAFFRSHDSALDGARHKSSHAHVSARVGQGVGRGVC